MKILSLIFVLFFCVVACKNETTSKGDLLIGNWHYVQLDKDIVSTLEGFNFSSNKQYFIIDSQGRMVPRLMEKIWSLDNDTLTLVDYNYVPEAIEKEGTSKFVIQKLSQDSLVLKSLNTKYPNLMKLKRGE